MKRIYILLILFVICQCSLPQDTIVISLNEAIEIAKNNSSIITNTDLLLQQAGSGKNDLWNLPPTEISYRYGQLYTPENGWQVNVNQEVGTVFQNFKQIKTNQIALDLVKKKNAQFTKELELKIKSLFLTWIYLYKKLEIASIKYEYVNKRMNLASLQESLGEKEPVELLLEQSQISSIETNYYECLYDIDITANELRAMMNTKSYLLPADKKLELYMIQKIDDTSTYKTNYKTEILNEKKLLYDALAESEKAGYFPSIQVGFFVQQFNPYETMAGIQAGVKVPLFYRSVRTKIEQNEMLSTQVKNEYNQALNQTQIEIESLILQLDKLFLRIRHFQDYALPASEMVIKTATTKYQLEEIFFEEFIKLIDDALQTQLEYFDCVNQYNQTALKLELYTD